MQRRYIPGNCTFLLKLIGGAEVPLDFRYYPRDQVHGDAMLDELAHGVISSSSFREYVFDWPERICVDYVIPAAKHWAVIRNHTELVGVQSTRDGWSLTLRDALNPDHTAQFGAKLVERP